MRGSARPAAPRRTRRCRVDGGIRGAWGTARPVAAVLALLLAPAAPRAQTATTPRLPLSVLVTDTSGSPVPDVAVHRCDGRRVATSDSAGRLTLSPAARATSCLITRRVGFVGQRLAAAELEGQEALLITLVPLAPVLREVRIMARADSVAHYTGKMLGFAQRFRSGQAPRSAFITRADIEQRRVTDTEQLIHGRIPNVRVVVDKRGRRQLVVTRGLDSMNRPCAGPIYYIDGVRIAGFDLDQLQPGMLEAIEVYRGVSQLPAEYRSPGANCGVVLFWTRVGGAPPDTARGGAARALPEGVGAPER